MIDAVSIKEGEGIPESDNILKSTTDRVAEATRAVKETVGEVCCEGWGEIKRAFNYTRKEPLALVMLGVGAGLIVGCWILYRRK